MKEGYQAGQAWFALCKFVLTIHNHPLVLHVCLEIVSRIISSLTYSEVEIRLTVSKIPFPSWRQKWWFLSSSLQEHPLTAMFQRLLSGLVKTSVNTSSFSTHGYTLSCANNLYMSSLFKCSLIWSSSAESLLQTFPLVISALQKPPGLLVPYCIAQPADTRMV